MVGYDYEVLETARGELAYSYHQGDVAMPIVLYIHGLAANMNGDKITQWLPDLIEKGYGVLRLDLNGHGASYGDLSDFKIGNAVKDVCDLLDYIHPESVLILASSVGAWTGLLVAQKRSEIKGVITMAAAPNAMDEVYLKPLSKVLPTAEADWEKEAVHTTEHFVPGFKLDLPWSMVEDSRQNDIFADGVLESIYVPVTLIHGTADSTVPIALSEKLMKLLPNSHMVTISGADHDLNTPLLKKLVFFNLGEMKR